MRPTFFNGLLIATPAIALVSGMAMTPIFVLLAISILCTVPRATLKTPEALLKNYRTLLVGLGFLLIWPLLTSIWSITFGHSLLISVRVLTICMIGLFAFTYVEALPAPSMRTVHRIAYSVIFASVLVFLEQLPSGGVIHAFYDHFHMDYIRFSQKEVNRGLCALSVLIWPLMLAFYKAGEPRKGWILFFIMSAAVMFMHSLSAKVGLFAGAISFFALRYFPRSLPRALGLLFPVFLLTFPILFLLMENTVFELPLIKAHLPNSSEHRLLIWHTLLEEVPLKPWLGWGIDTTRALPLSAEQLKFIWLKEPPLHPHSPSLQLIVELGIVGLLLTAIGVFVLLREWVRMPVEDSLRRRTGGALIVAYLATGLSSFGIWQIWWIATFWMAGMLWRYFSKMQSST